MEDEEQNLFPCIFHTSKGSVTVDASISLPVFILSFALLLSLIYEAAEEDALYRDLARELNIASSAAGAANIEVPFMVAIGKTKTRGINRSLYYRPFSGESAEVRQRDTTVYIFPRSGTRYHVAGCSTMDRHDGYVSISKQEAISLGYTECRLCGFGGRDYFKKGYIHDYRD